VGGRRDCPRRTAAAATLLRADPGGARHARDRSRPLPRASIDRGSRTPASPGEVVMMLHLALRLPLSVGPAASLVVPSGTRAEWRREWHAELRHLAAHLRRRRMLTWEAHMDLIARALGSLPDAAWIRRQFTLDADAVRDGAHAVRMLVKTPGFTIVALVIFAL